MTIALIFLAVAVLILGCQQASVPAGWVIIALAVLTLLIAAGAISGHMHLP